MKLTLQIGNTFKVRSAEFDRNILKTMKDKQEFPSE